MYFTTRSLLKGFVLVGTVSAVLCYGEAPKIIYKNFKSSYTINEGGRVKLRCLVTGADDPEANRTLTAWRKDGVAKHRSVVRKSPMWARFKVKNCKYLRIRNVQKSDAGRYLCIAKNQHGMTHAFINLTVIPKSTNSTAVYNHIPRPTAAVKRPKFGSKQTHHAIKIGKGKELKLSCRAKGSPRPNVIWFKNRQPFKRTKKRFKLTPWGLTIKKLKHKDSGTYRCFVWNRFGNITKTFYIQVLGKEHQDDEPPRTTGSPVIQESFLKNATALEGQSVTFTCAALSDKKPHFAWVWVSSHDSTPFHKVMNSTMSLPNIRFQEMKRTVEGGTSYLQKLKLLNVSKSDQGRYACFVGHDGRKIVSSYVHLAVRQLKPTPDLTEVQGLTKKTSETMYLIGGVEVPLAAVIAVPVALFTILIVAIIWCYVQIVKQRKAYAKAASYVLSSNGVVMNGTGSNGVGMNGPGSNGVAMNGPGSNGVVMNGPRSNGVVMNGPGSNGVVMNGTCHMMNGTCKGHQNIHNMETFSNGHILHRTTPTPEVKHQHINYNPEVPCAPEVTYETEVKYEPEVGHRPEVNYDDLRENRTRNLEECHSENNLAISTENSLESCDRTTKSLVSDITDEGSTQDIPSKVPNNLKETICIEEIPSEVRSDESTRTNVNSVGDVNIDDIRDSFV